MEKIKDQWFRFISLFIVFVGLSGCMVSKEDTCLGEGNKWLKSINVCEKYGILDSGEENFDRFKVEGEKFYSEYPTTEYLLSKMRPYTTLSQYIDILIEERRNNFVKKYQNLDFSKSKKNRTDFKMYQYFNIESLIQDFRYKHVLLEEEIFYKKNQKQRILENINYDIQHSQILDLRNFFVKPEKTTQEIKIFLEDFINKQQEIRNPNAKDELKKFTIKDLKDSGIYWLLKPHNSVENLVFYLPKNPLGTELLEIKIPLEIFIEDLKKSYRAWFVKTQDKFEVIERY